MSYIMVDVETDGPIPGDYSMICIGAVVVTQELDKRFSAKLQPISNRYVPEALTISGFSREETLAPPFEDAAEVMLVIERLSAGTPPEAITFPASSSNH